MRSPDAAFRVLLAAVLLASAGAALALQSDRQQPLLVNADSTDGTLGDGIAVLRGNVEIRQGTLLVRADLAEVEKAEGRVRRVLLTGNPVLLQQEIENEGLVSATAQQITYQVATGIVTLTGAADVKHPQYHVSGEELVYDMNQQHFSGTGAEGSSRVRIELAPEVVPSIDEATKGAGEPEPSGTPDAGATEPAADDAAEADGAPD